MPSFAKPRLLVPLAVLLLATHAPADELPASDGSWITLAGTVESANADSFLLDYGAGTITVETDDADGHAEGQAFLPGDRVRVRGVVDAELFDTRTIEAEWVEIEGRDAAVQASARDEEGEREGAFLALTKPASPGLAVIDGTVTRVGEATFILDKGPRRILVDIAGLVEDPLDDAGYPQLDVGDRVRVLGTIDGSLLEERRLIADSVTSLPPREPGPR